MSDVRLELTFDEEEWAWLERRATDEGLTPAEVVRRAVERLRASDERETLFENLLRETAGIFQKDGGPKDGGERTP